MKLHLEHAHPWNLSPEAAAELQAKLADKICITDRLPPIKRIAGVDISYFKDSEELIAGVVVLDSDSLDLLEKTYYRGPCVFPYIPSLFSFREVPPLLKALEQLSSLPDLIVCDGHGLAHPRRLGLACHLGLLLDLPTIGCGKTPLLKPLLAPGLERGEHSPILLEDKIVGAALRTQPQIRPVYVSPGHRINLAHSIEWVLKLSEHYRQPETTRQANSYVNQLRQIQKLPQNGKQASQETISPKNTSV
jgi:deoxyribonuclease V